MNKVEKLPQLPSTIYKQETKPKNNFSNYFVKELTKKNLKKYNLNRELNLKDFNNITRSWIDSIESTNFPIKTFSVIEKQEKFMKKLEKED